MLMKANAEITSGNAYANGSYSDADPNSFLI